MRRIISFQGWTHPPQKFIGHVQGILISGRRIGYIICFALILFVIYSVWFSPLVVEHSPGLKKLSSDNSHFVYCFDNLTTLSLHNELFYLLVLLVYLFICYIYLTLRLNFMGFFIYLFCFIPLSSLSRWYVHLLKWSLDSLWCYFIMPISPSIDFIEYAYYI